MALNLEVASSSSFRDFSKRSFCDSEVDVGSGGMSAICNRPKVVYDIISDRYVETYRRYVYVNIRDVSFKSFRENRSRHLCNA